MAVENKNVTARISPETETFLKENFKTASSGLTQCAEIVRQSFLRSGNIHSISEDVEVLEQIRRASLKEIKDKLSSDEWMYLADSLNGTMITPIFRTLNEGLIASIEDSDLYDGLGEKYKVNVSEFIDKVRSLTGAQIDAIYSRIENFWNNPNQNLKTWSEEI